MSAEALFVSWQPIIITFRGDQSEVDTAQQGEIDQSHWVVQAGAILSE